MPLCQETVHGQQFELRYLFAALAALHGSFVDLYMNHAEPKFFHQVLVPACEDVIAKCKIRLAGKTTSSLVLTHPHAHVIPTFDHGVLGVISSWSCMLFQLTYITRRACSQQPAANLIVYVLVQHTLVQGLPLMCLPCCRTALLSLKVPFMA